MANKILSAEEILNLLESGNVSELELSDEEQYEMEQDDTRIFTDPLVRLENRNLIRIGTDTLRPFQSELEEPISDDDAKDNKENVAQNISATHSNWVKEAFQSPQLPQWGEDEIHEELLSPLAYFEKYLPSEYFSEISTYTNIYALQNDKQKFKPSTPREIKTLFALHIMMGCLKFPQINLYWERALQIDCFVNNMTRNRFYELRNNLHLVNNLEQENNTDKFYKVRPIYEKIRQRMLELPIQKEICIDEQLIPFKGHLSVKQYIKNKPNPWGIKLFLLCAKDGIAYDFIMYQGARTNLNPDWLKEYGFGATVILELSKRLDEKGYFLYYDNYFSSYKLLQQLKIKNIYAACTIRINRFQNPPFSSDNESKNKKRGHMEELVNSNGDIVVVKWMDNRKVVLASNFVGIGEVDLVSRWDKKLNKYINVTRPEIVKKYNHGMGGVDLMDRMISLYRIYIKSKKWTLRLIFHAVDLAIVNSWFEYKSHAKKECIPEKDILDLLHFKMRIAEELMKVRESKHARGRPSSSLSTEPPSKRKKETRPSDAVRLDQVDHLPEYENRSRCKL